MTVEIERSVVLAASPAEVFAHVDDLSRYPEWMELVHDVAPAAPDAPDRPTWDVELRAHIGPLARSKRLRMARTVHRPAARVVFERAEVDGREHAPWVLEATTRPLTAGPTGSTEPGASTELTMHLRYGGSLWTGALLQRVLDEHVERGAAALVAMLGAPH